MRTMYDAVTAANIPATAAMVAGYVDKIKLEPWSAADWARFPNATKVQIVKKATSNFGHVLDVEPGDATPPEAPGWVKMRRAAGADPTVYCNRSTWPTVQAEFVRQGVAQPHYWIAKYDGVQELPTLNGITAVAKQYAGDVAPGIDLSVVADYWPGVDAAPGGGSSPGSSTRGIEIMERYPAKAIPANGTVRVLLPGGDGAAVIIRPGAQPVWLGHIFAWGDNDQGIGHDPAQANSGKPVKVDKTRKFPLPGALWADVGYSSNSDAVIEAVG